ncbi:MAG: ABC transporter substrate-binding protein [Cyclobacteriaceae bacterium]
MYKYTLHLFAACVICLAGCGQEQGSQQGGDASGQDRSGLSYAKTFSLTEQEGYTEVRVSEPWQGSSASATYYLVPKGGAVPAELQGQAVIRTPVERVVALSTSYLPMIKMLGMAHTVMGFPDTSLIADDTYRSMAARKQLTDLGSGTQIDRELLLDVQPEVVFGFGVGEPAAIERVLQAADRHMIYNTDFLEEHPLGRAEWIRFFGAFYDRQALADSLFTAIHNRYDSLKQSAASQTHHPDVMASNLYGDTWYMPGGNSWGATFIEDAGGHYLWADSEGTGSLNLAFEPVLARAQNADVWLNVSNYKSLEEMGNADSRYRYFGPYKTGRVYNPLKKGTSANGNKYYELGYARPDLVLEDLIRIMQSEKVPDSLFHFYQKLN